VRAALLLAACALPAAAQDAAKVQPNSYKVVFENDRMRVLEYNSRPGMGACGQGMHTHPAHLTVVVTGGKTRLKLPDGSIKDITSKDGDVFWTEADIPHEIENISGRNLRLLLIETKDPTQQQGTATAKPR
jgi:hypothetical protein